jgi:hypothetical protein
MPEQSLQVHQPESAELTLIQIIANAALDPRVDPAKMKELLDIQERIERREAEVSFKRAMHEIQSELPVILKTAKGHNNNYARLEDIDRITAPFLTKHGFSVSYTSEVVASGVVWHCIVSHTAGHQERFSTPPLPADKSGSMNPIQGIFSAASYGQRYAFCAAFKIVTRGMDDDGAGTTFLTEEQVMQVSDLLNDCKIKAGTPPMAAFLKFAETDSVAHIQQFRFTTVVAALRQKLSKESK